MDGEEDEFFSGNHSDGGGTPVQDENAPGSDAEEERKESCHSEDENSHGEGAAQAMETNGLASGSDNEGHKREDSDSEEEEPVKRGTSDIECTPPPKRRGSNSDIECTSPPKRRGSNSDIECTSPPKRRGSNSDIECTSPPKRRGSNSDIECTSPPKRRGSNSDIECTSPPKRRGSNSDIECTSPPKRRGSNSDIECTSPPKRRGSNSDIECTSPPKRRGSNSDIEGPPVKHRGCTSDMEEKETKQAAAGSDSENEDQPPSPARSRHSTARSDSETEVPEHKAQIESDGKEEECGEKKGKWKAVMHSDSEDEVEARSVKAAAGSGQEKDSPAKQVVDDSEDDDAMPMKRKKAILSDSEDEEEKADEPASKKSRTVSDDENSDSNAGSEAPDKTMAKLRELGSESEDEDDGQKAAGGKKDEKTLFGSDSESGDEEEKMIADIFGDSGDEEGEEFTGFNQEDLEGDKNQSQASAKKAMADDSDSDEGVDRGGGQDTSFMSDFDVMLARKKAQSGKRRRNRDGGTFISDADDVVSAMIAKMTEAAEEDRTLNAQKKPALKKLTLLPTVVMHLKKQDLKETFIDSGVMSAIKEWIGPLPDKSLPALKIRADLLKILQELPSVSQETLKHSGIGRAVMFLYKHPKESRPNKDLALKLINEWSRPIFGLTSNYKGMTREERQQRDLDQQMPPKRLLSSGGQTPHRDLEKVLTGEEKALRPGDPGFCARARVPMPSNKDYVVRPKWNVESESRAAPVKKGVSRVDKQLRRFADIKRMTKTGHAVKISVQGNRMPL
ncbi:protein IWS1 homolog isoform X1 [Salvelinus namaycush]|uniref:Protein IWS1 homolog isoform X1 n=1 Tax=Salvelinus namaycush TaxID=8040 RepID=A0A8U0TVI8_SALNM|nr:protein IWS1 homolog isoform X1 [Salvelinus namaycush]XP_038829937.1 protein IWS1 homolog isoform X1 [Salvelinus namaycush]XP_038829938.1 protein IWS1 homolog isoform X1 [Salvelinus namaycush]